MRLADRPALRPPIHMQQESLVDVWSDLILDSFQKRCQGAYQAHSDEFSGPKHVDPYA